MFSNTFKAHTKFILDLKSNQPITEKDIVFFKDEKQIFIKFNEHKIKLEPTEQEKKVYKTSADIDQSLVLFSLDGKYLVYFQEHPDYLCAIDWLETAMHKEFFTAYKIHASSVINNATHKVYLNKELSFIKEDNELYFEFEGLKVKLNFYENNHLYKKSNDVDQAVVISTNKGDFLIQFLIKSDYLDVMDLLDQATHHAAKTEA